MHRGLDMTEFTPEWNTAVPYMRSVAMLADKYDLVDHLSTVILPELFQPRTEQELVPDLTGVQMTDLALVAYIHEQEELFSMYLM